MSSFDLPFPSRTSDTPTEPGMERASHRRRSTTTVAPETPVSTPSQPADRDTATTIATWGDGLPYVREHYLLAIRQELRRTVESCVTMGKRLIVMKAMEPHGQWGACLRQVGLDERTAQRLMEAARRLSAITASEGARRTVLPAIGSQGKLFELLTLSAEQFQALTEGDAVAGFDLDEVATMGVRDLRRALHEARANLAARDARAQHKEQQIERLQCDLDAARHRWAKATPDEQIDHLRTQVQGAVIEAMSTLGAQGEHVSSVRQAADRLRQHSGITGTDPRPFLTGVLAELTEAIDTLRIAWGLPSRLTPDSLVWATPTVTP